MADWLPIATVVSALFVGGQLALGIKVFIDSRRLDAKARALEFVARWREFGFMERRRAFVRTLAVIRQRNQRGDIAPELVADDAELRSTASEILNFFEELSIAVQEGVADFAVVQRYFAGIAPYQWAECAPFSAMSQKKDPGMYVEAEWLVRQVRDIELSEGRFLSGLLWGPVRGFGPPPLVLKERE